MLLVANEIPVVQPMHRDILPVRGRALAPSTHISRDNDHWPAFGLRKVRSTCTQARTWLAPDPACPLEASARLLPTASAPDVSSEVPVVIKDVTLAVKDL